MGYGLLVVAVGGADCLGEGAVGLGEDVLEPGDIWFIGVWGDLLDGFCQRVKDWRRFTSGSVDVWVERWGAAGCEGGQRGRVGDTEDGLDVKVALEICAIFKLGLVVWGLLVGTTVDDDELELVGARDRIGAVCFQKDLGV